MSLLTNVITAQDAETRNGSLDALCRNAPLEDLMREGAALDRFRRSSDNLYERVRALFFLYALHRFHIPTRPGVRGSGADSFRRLHQPAEAPV